MDRIKADWYLAVRSSLEIMGFGCATCKNFGDGVCSWSWKRVLENDFCTQWVEREARDADGA